VSDTRRVLTTHGDVRSAIADAESTIRRALQILTERLPEGYVITNTSASARRQSVAGGRSEYVFFAQITVEVSSE
jgi:hypothetical protein